MTEKLPADDEPSITPTEAGQAAAAAPAVRKPARKAASKSAARKRPAKKAAAPTADISDARTADGDVPAPAGDADAGAGADANATEDAGTDDAAPRTKAEKLEAKAARLRAKQAAADRADAERAAAKIDPASAERAAPAAQPWRIAAFVLAAVLVLTVVLGGIYAVHEHNTSTDSAARLARATSLTTARNEAIKTGSTVAVQFASYDYRHLTTEFAQVTKYFTADFAKTFRTTSASLSTLIAQYKGHSTAVVRSIGASAVTRSSATLLVFLDQTVTSSTAKTPRIDRNRMQMLLVRQKGKWLVKNITLL